MSDDCCRICGKTGCPNSEDPLAGPMLRHNQAAFAELLRRRQAASEEDAA